MQINYNGMCTWFCDPCCQKYLGETKAFFAISDIQRLAPGPTPNIAEDEHGVHLG